VRISEQIHIFSAHHCAIFIHQFANDTHSRLDTSQTTQIYKSIQKQKNTQFKTGTFEYGNNIESMNEKDESEYDTDRRQLLYDQHVPTSHPVGLTKGIHVQDDASFQHDSISMPDHAWSTLDRKQRHPLCMKRGPQ
jgi:hypothetical protein